MADINATDGLLISDRAIAQHSTITINRPERSTLDLANCSVTPNGSTPTITVQCLLTNDSGASAALVMYGSVDNVFQMTPAFRLSKTNFVSTAFASGHQFWYSYDAVTWTAFDNRTSDASYYYFSNNTAFTGNIVYFCSMLPWLHANTLAWIESLEASGYVAEAPSSTGFNYVFDTRTATEDDYGNAITQSALYSFRISSGAGDAPDGSPKRHMVLVSGIHGAEDIGNHVLSGAVEFLTSEDAQAAIVRDWFNITVYPLVASAGRRGGANREDFQVSFPNDDVNREWDASTIETLQKHKAAILADCNDAVTVLFDFHGTWLSPYTYINTYVDVPAFDAAIDTYRPGITVNQLTTLGTTMWYGATQVDAVLSGTVERNMIEAFSLSDAKDYGADVMRAVSDMANDGFFSAGVNATDTLLLKDVVTVESSTSGIRGASDILLLNDSAAILVEGSQQMSTSQRTRAAPSGGWLQETQDDIDRVTPFGWVQETVTPSGPILRAEADGAFLLDIAKLELLLARAVSDKLALTDSVTIFTTVIEAIERLVTDGIFLRDEGIKAFGLTRRDGTLVVDTLGFQRERDLAYSEGLLLRDDILRLLEASQRDPLLLHDVLVRVRSLTQRDDILLLDTAVAERISIGLFNVLLTDALMIADSMIREQSVGIVTRDGVLLRDATIRERDIDLTHMDMTLLRDGVTTEVTVVELIQRLVSDGVLFSDDVIMDRTMQLNEWLQLSDSRVSELVRSLRDSMLTSDAKAFGRDVSRVSMMLLDEVLGKAFEFTRPEGLLVSDQATAQWFGVVLEFLVYARLDSIDLLGITVSSDDLVGIELSSEDLLGIELSHNTWRVEA